MRIKTNYQQLRCDGKFHGTLKRAKALRKQRDARRELPSDRLATPLKQRFDAARVLIPLGNAGSEAVSRIHAQNTRLKNWTEARAGLCTRMRTNDLGRYSSRCTYTHYTYTPLVQSYGVNVGKAIYFHFDGTVRRVIAPRGYRWETDSNGIRLVSLSDPQADYHPTAGELLAGMRSVVAKLRENLRIRRESFKKQNKKQKQQAAAVKRAEREGATVCIADSIRAGNCVAGSINWAKRHGLEPQQHYRPSQVLALANGDIQRVALVVTIALKRHRREMERGFALLEEHTCK